MLVSGVTARAWCVRRLAVRCCRHGVYLFTPRVNRALAAREITDL
jgi:hypothetical protein